MTVSTVMQLQKHQPGSRRFTILVGDSQGQQHIAVMAGQMLAGEVGLQLRITYGGKQLGHRTPKPPVRQEKIRHLKNKVRDAFLSQIPGAERLGNLPSDAPHLHFQLLLLHIPACNAEGGTIAEAVILAENHPRIRHAQNACGTGHIIENIAVVPLLSGVMDNEDANAVVIGELFQAGQVLVVLGIGIDLCGSIRKQIAKICAAAGVLPGTYERRDATEIVRKIQESVVSHLEQAIRTLERDRLHILLLSALATEQLSVNLNRTGATLTEDIEEGERIKSLEKSTQLSEKAKMRKSALLYLIETNLYLVNERKEEAIDSSKLSELLSFAKWIIYLQNSSDLCFHTDSDTKLIVEDDYRIDVELGENYSQTFEKESQRRIIAEPFNLRGDNTDRDFFEKVANAFYEDLGVHFKVLESVLHHLSDSSFSHDNVEFDEIAPNVIKAKATDVLNDYLSFVVENVPVEDVKSAYDFLTIVPGQLKTICDTTHPILPIWEREKRNHCFAVRPIYMSNNDYIYSPIIMEEVRKRWIEGFLQFYPPFEIGLERTCTALYAWKNNYEHLFSSEVEVLLKESGCEYAKHDVDLRREDRRGNHPTIDVLGDYDVIGLNTTQKRIFIIECKVLQPIGSVFEHSNQQKRFFTKEKFDEKFQKRIDYFSKVAMSFFANHGYDTEGFTINPYMVVNKVFSSYYKHVQFPIVTFDELKREIQL